MDLDHLVRLAVKTVLGYSVFVVSFWVGLVGVHVWTGYSIENVANAVFQTKKNAVIGETAIKIEIAESEEERVKGLSGREAMKDKDGLLFIFDNPDLHGIWMKEMNFPIDIIWINEGMKVVHIEKSVSPETYPTVFKPNVKSKYVLEVKSGFVEREGIKKGDLLTLF